MKIKEQIGKLN